MGDLRAWKATCDDPHADYIQGKLCSVVFARSRGAARHAIVVGAQKEGVPYSYGDFHVERWPKYDCIAGKSHLTREGSALMVVVADQLLEEIATA